MNGTARDRIVALVAVLVAFALLAFGMAKAYHPAAAVIEGTIDATQIDVASKVAGRVASVDVRLGDTVHAGQRLFTIDSPELRAALQAARGTERSATAVESRAKNGSRPEAVEAALAQAKSAAEAAGLAQTTYRRTQALYDAQVVSRQMRDNAYSAWQVALHQADSARNVYEGLRAGARAEDIAAASGAVQTSRGAVALANAQTNDTRIDAPIDGEIAAVDTHAGEIAPQGYPVVSILDVGHPWATLNVREDQLEAFEKDTTIVARVPALSNARLHFKVYYRAALGAFATDRSTRTTSGDDLRTFEVRARPLERIADLRPGMSLIVDR
jgi:HlyD family secretion protein